MENKPTAENIEQAKNLIANAQNICLHLHPSPDGDSYGSALGLASVLRAAGKTVTVYQGDSIPPRFATVYPTVETITPEPVTAENLLKHDLFISVDSANPTQISRKPEFVLPEMDIINIDHHFSKNQFGSVRIIDTEMGSCAEHIYSLLPALGLSITKDAATCFYMGMYTDTGGLQYGSVTHKTIESMAQCFALGDKIQDRLGKFLQGYGKSELDLLATCLSKREYINGMMLVVVPNEDIIASKMENPSTHIIAGFLSGKMYDTQILCVAFETEKNKFRVSARADGLEGDTQYDMTEFMGKLGGGGHKGAAGAMVVADTPETARETILKAWTETVKNTK